MKYRLVCQLLLFKVSISLVHAENTTETVFENSTVVQGITSNISQTTTVSSTQSDAPHSTQSDAPHSTQSDAPHSTQSDAPHSTQSDAPHNIQSDAPHSMQSDAPHSTQSDAPHSTQQPVSTTTMNIGFPALPPLTTFTEDGTKAECKMSVPGCEQLQTKTCLGSTLPYSHTSLALINDSRTQADVENMLTLWAGLRHAPKCWEVVQPFLCAVYMPECNTSGHFVYLPGKEVCAVTREPCRIVESTRGWPSFLQCDNKHFIKGCTVSLIGLKLAC